MTNKIILFALVFLFTNTTYSQSPWVNNKGSVYAQFSTTYLSYGNIVTDKLNEIVPADFRSIDITTN